MAGRFVATLSVVDGMRGMERLLELEEIELGEGVREARERLAEADGRLGELRMALDSVEREARRLEGDVDSLTRKAEAEDRRLYDGSVANPKELEAIQHEVASIRTRRSRVEDEL